MKTSGAESCGGLRRRLPGVDLLRVQDVGLAGANDPTVLEWAANEGRVLLTHEVNSMTKFAYERIGRGLPTPGVLVVQQASSLAKAIEDLIILAECSREWEGQVLYLPL